MPKQCHNVGVEELTAAFEMRRREEHSRLQSALSESSVRDEVAKEFRILSDAVQSDKDTWKHLLPGRPILNAFAAKAKVEIGMLKRLYIKSSQSHENDPFADIRRIFSDFARLGAG